MTKNNTFSSRGRRRLPETTAGTRTQLRDPRRRLFQTDGRGSSQDEELVVAYTWPQEGGWRVY